MVEHQKKAQNNTSQPHKTLRLCGTGTGTGMMVMFSRLSNTWSIWSPKGFLGIFVIWALPSLGLCLVQQSHVVEQDIVIL